MECDHFSNSNGAVISLSNSPICHITLLVRACLSFWVEPYRSNICYFRAMTLSFSYLVQNWSIFTISIIIGYSKPKVRCHVQQRGSSIIYVGHAVMSKTTHL